jgi:hypothetical protein
MAVDGTRKAGVRFSLQYVERGEPLRDSVKARRRISSLVLDMVFARNALGGSSSAPYEKLHGLLNRELGLPFNSIEDFCLKSELLDFLDAVSVLHQGFAGRSGQAYFLKDARRIFQEENLSYEIDDDGGVHPLIDAEFARGTTATIQALSAPRYQATLGHFEKAIETLGGTRHDGKAAIRNVFLACETLFKLVAPANPPRLANAELNAFRPFAIDACGSDATAKNVSSKMVASLTDWVEAAHFYRHAQKEEQPTEPPFALAVLLVSQGAGFLRWIASLDQPAGGKLAS